MDIISHRKRMTTRKRDGLYTEGLKIKPKEVDNSLDALFGKIPHHRYRPHPINDFDDV
jgi:hypothetical protein